MYYILLAFNTTEGNVVRCPENASKFPLRREREGGREREEQREGKRKIYLLFRNIEFHFNKAFFLVN